MKPLETRGFSLIEVLVGVVMMGILAFGMASLLQNQYRETRALTEKLAALDVQNLAVSSMVDGTGCLYALTHPTPLLFDATAVSSSTPQVLTPSVPLYTRVTAGVPGPVLAQIGSAPSVVSSSLIVSGISLRITGGSGDTFSGQWEIEYDSTKTVRSLKPTTVAMTLKADISTPTAAQIISCHTTAPGTNPDCDNSLSPEASTNKPCLMQMYRCPKNLSTPPGSWASYGCLGQLQTQPSCENYAWVGVVHTSTVPCTPAGKALLQ